MPVVLDTQTRNGEMETLILALMGILVYLAPVLKPAQLINILQKNFKKI